MVDEIEEEIEQYLKDAFAVLLRTHAAMEIHTRMCASNEYSGREKCQTNKQIQ